MVPPPPRGRDADAEGVGSVQMEPFGEGRFLVKESSEVCRESRAKEKAEARRQDEERLAAGEDPEVLQRENSIFTPEFFESAEIEYPS